MVEIYAQRVVAYYEEIKDISLRERLVIEFLVDDIGSVINEFIGRFTDDDVGKRLWLQDLNNQWKVARIMDKIIMV